MKDDKSYSEKKLIPTQKEWDSASVKFEAELINRRYNETLHLKEMVQYYSFRNPHMLEMYLKKLIIALENNIKIKHC